MTTLKLFPSPPSAPPILYDVLIVRFQRIGRDLHGTPLRTLKQGLSEAKAMLCASSFNELAHGDRVAVTVIHVPDSGSED
jgi:hypothetical protein